MNHVTDRFINSCYPHVPSVFLSKQAPRATFSRNVLTEQIRLREAREELGVRSAQDRPIPDANRASQAWDKNCGAGGSFELKKTMVSAKRITQIQRHLIPRAEFT